MKKDRNMELSQAATDETELLTRYIFLDTQCYRELKLDWNSQLLQALQEHAAAGRLRLLITDITKREVIEQLDRSLDETLVSLRKHDVSLSQIASGISVVDKPSARKVLARNFEDFLSKSKAILVPLLADAQEVFSDYFERSPPFGDGRKKSEFPDAFVIKSLLRWCAANKQSAYVVSGDQDLEKCCSVAGPLHHCRGLPEILSLVASNEILRANLLTALNASYAIAREIDECVDELRVSPNAPDITLLERNVENVRIIELYVIKRTGNHFYLEADVDFDSSFTFYGTHFDERLDRFRRFGETTSNTHTVTVEIDADFDPAKPASLDVHHVHVSLDELNIELDTLPSTGLRLCR